MAAIAYRSGERLIDERTGEIHDYTRKSGVDDTFIMSPNDAPDWASDRATLWSTVELTEKRKDAQLARELNVALPIELSKSESKALIQDYVKRAFVDKGMIADVAMHDMKSDNPHAHIMLTMREIGPDGFGPKNRDWNAKPQMQNWREQWALTTNQHLEKAGHDVRIDHRSLEAQDIKRKPTIHVGVHASAMEKRGVRTELGDKNRDIVSFNQRVAAMLETVQQSIKKLMPENIRKATAPLVKNPTGAEVLQAVRDQQQAEKAQKREQKRQQQQMTRGRNGLTH